MESSLGAVDCWAGFPGISTTTAADARQQTHRNLAVQRSHAVGNQRLWRRLPRKRSSPSSSSAPCLSQTSTSSRGANTPSPTRARSAARASRLRSCTCSCLSSATARICCTAARRCSRASSRASSREESIFSFEIFYGDWRWETGPDMPVKGRVMCDGRAGTLCGLVLWKISGKLATPTREGCARGARSMCFRGRYCFATCPSVAPATPCWLGAISFMSLYLNCWWEMFACTASCLWSWISLAVCCSFHADTLPGIPNAS